MQHWDRTEPEPENMYDGGLQSDTWNPYSANHPLVVLKYLFSVRYGCVWPILWLVNSCFKGTYPVRDRLTWSSTWLQHKPGNCWLRLLFQAARSRSLRSTPGAATHKIPTIHLSSLPTQPQACRHSANPPGGHMWTSLSWVWFEHQGKSDGFSSF